MLSEHTEKLTRIADRGGAVSESTSIVNKPSSGSGEKADRPVLEHYSDYRVFLRDMYEFLKRSRRGGYTFRQMADEAGLKSAGFLNLVFSGRRNIDPAKATQLARALRLTSGEARFLRDLIAMNQSDEVTERRRNLRLLVRRPRFREHFQVDDDLLDYLENWYVVAIHELVGIDGFQADSEWIARRLSPPVTPKQADEALQTLHRLNLIEFDDNSNVRRTVKEVRTPNELHHEVVRAYHAQATELGRWALNVVPAEQRNFGAVTATVRTRDYPALLDFVHKQRKEMVSFLRQLQQVPEQDMVVQINYQAFPLSPLGTVDTGMPGGDAEAYTTQPQASKEDANDDE